MVGMAKNRNDTLEQSSLASEADDDRIGYRKPPMASRFKPGHSGNPAGRKRKAKSQTGSAFTLILGKTVLVRAKGKTAACSIEEALQLRTYQEALKGKNMAVREVLRWILKREIWLAKNMPPIKRPPTFAGTRQDPDNANEAMILLGIAAHDPARSDRNQERAHLLLEPWVVKAGLSRSRRARSLTSKDLDDVRHSSRDDGSINWPLGEPR